MIEFPCTCGYRFSVPQELAGSSLQCPECKRLMDVPKLSDVGSLEEDGTIRLLDAEPEKEDRDRVAELMDVFRPGRMDEDGGEIDLRVTMDDVLRAGVIEEGTIGAHEEAAPPAPKYDPVTGELIEVLSVKNEATRPVRAIPVGPQLLNYSKEQGLGRLSMWLIPNVLFLKGGSVAVLAVIIVVHFIGLIPLALFSFHGLFIGGMIILFCFVLVCAHYGNIVEEMGPMDLDELPTPLRGAEVTGDIVFPFLHFTGAIFACYFPALVMAGRHTMHVGFGVAVLSTFVFPAVFLGVCTSGDLVNLRPDRILGVVAKCGGHYFLSVALWIAAASCYLMGMAGAMLNTVRLLWGTTLPIPKPPIGGLASFGILIMGIVLMHAFCVHLALLYRKRHESFPWILQKHISAKAQEPLQRRRKPYMAPLPRSARRPKPQAPPASGAMPVGPLRAQPVQPMRVEPLEQPGPRAYNRAP
jgi:hypothetical protein